MLISTTPQIIYNEPGLQLRETRTLPDQIGRLEVLTRRYAAVDYLREVPHLTTDR